MLIRCPPYFTQPTGVVTRGIALREIQQAYGNFGKGLSWTEEFRRALAREDLALTTVRAYHGDLDAFLRWYGLSVMLTSFPTGHITLRGRFRGTTLRVIR